jgi:hypothetical protein
MSVRRHRYSWLRLAWFALMQQRRRRLRLQRPPSAAPQDPSALGAYAWWRADDVAWGEGTPVNDWPDRVGGGYALDSVGSTMPLVSMTGFNGQPALVFTATDWMFCTGFSYQKPMSLFIAVAPTNPGTLTNIAQCGMSGVALRVHVNAPGDIELDSNPPGISTSVPGVFNIGQKMVIGGTVSDTEQKVYFNGVEPAMAQVNAPDLGEVNAFILSGETDGLTGMVAEVALFNYALTQAQIDGLQSYFHERYGL